MKGIVLAGGSGTRLYPITKGVSKQLLPVYNKPMVYYPISVLLLAGIKEILIISTPDDMPMFQRLLGDGTDLGISFEYKIQEQPNGLAEAFILGEDFVGKDDVCLILGDNIFYGHGFSKVLEKSLINVSESSTATVFGYYVNDPERYGVVEFDGDGSVISIDEKPQSPKSNYAIVGLYFYPNSVIEIAKSIQPSDRGELEITSINQEYLSKRKLKVELMGRGYAWFDTGTHDSLQEASNFIQTIENRQGLKVASLEEIVFKKGYITAGQLESLAKPLQKNEYGKYLSSLVKKK